MEIKQKFLTLFQYLSDSIVNPFDVRDVFLIAGWGMVTYGLYLLAPWIGYSVGGFLLMILALLMKN